MILGWFWYGSGMVLGWFWYGSGDSENRDIQGFGWNNVWDINKERAFSLEDQKLIEISMLLVDSMSKYTSWEEVLGKITLSMRKLLPASDHPQFMEMMNSTSMQLILIKLVECGICKMPSKEVKKMDHDEILEYVAGFYSPGKLYYELEKHGFIEIPEL